MYRMLTLRLLQRRRAPYEPLLSSTFHRVSPCYAYRYKLENETDAQYVARLKQELEEKFIELGPETVAAFVAEPGESSSASRRELDCDFLSAHPFAFDLLLLCVCFTLSFPGSFAHQSSAQRQDVYPPYRATFPPCEKYVTSTARYSSVMRCVSVLAVLFYPFHTRLRFTTRD